MKKHVFALVGFLSALGAMVIFQNCGRDFEVMSTGMHSLSQEEDWLKTASLQINSSPLPLNRWSFPKYSLLPITEAGSAHDSMPTRRRTNITSSFQTPVKFFQSSALNVYNPNVLKVDGDSQYPFRMYFFGWAKEPCNTHLAYHPEHKLAQKKNENWCDSIFVARSKYITGPWQVLEEGNIFGNNLQNPERWKPILNSNGRDKVWDYHHTGDPSVIQVNGTYFMAYSVTGHDLDKKSEWSSEDTDGDFAAVAGAYSLDGVNWIKLRQPLIVSEKEAGFAPKNHSREQWTNVHLARPTLMYDEGKFKLWYDYWFESFPAMGYAELEAPPTLDAFSQSQWTIKQGNGKPAIRNWTNPTVVKTPNGYFSYSDSLLGEYDSNNPWDVRKLHEAYSTDGMNWVINGHIPHLSNCMGHAPETLFLNNELHLLYHCVGDSRDKDSMFFRKRVNLTVSDPRPRVCTPGAKQSCAITNGSGERICHSEGTGYGSCSVKTCNEGFEKINNSCVKKICTSPIAKEYVTTSLAYFTEAQKIPEVSALAYQCFGQTSRSVQALNLAKWECTLSETAVANVRSCVDQIELNKCRLSLETKTYLRTAVTYLEGAVNVPKVAAQALVCLRDLKKDLPLLEKSNWPCAYANSTMVHISTCIEQVIKPALGQN